MFQFAHEQYALVLGSRKTLFDFCSIIKREDLVKENNNFGKGSIRNLLVHCVNTYNFWIGECALGVETMQIEPATINGMDEILRLYEKVDSMMEEFIKTVETKNLSSFKFYLGGEETSESAVKLFSHVITHEYHHKGQILSMARQLGYTPVDTDIMR